MIFAKTGAGGTQNVWFYDVKADGFSLDDKRTPIAENDLPDVGKRLREWQADPSAEASRGRTEKSFFVPKSEIAENDYDLSINRYKEVVYEKTEYESTETILSRLEALDREIAEQTAALREMLK